VKRIYVVSKYRGDVERNILVARTLCRAIVGEGYAPFASHIFAAQFLDDDNAEHRNRGIKSGHAWMDVCDEVWVWTHDLPLSKGMLLDVAYALEIGKPVIDWSPGRGRVPWDVEKWKESQP